MIVFDLRCAKGHVFEAWFGSSAAFEAQSTGGQVLCPICDDADVVKAVMAPNIPSKGNSRPDTPIDVKAAMRALAAAQAKALEGSQWVGKAFPDRARAMHAGDEAHSAIHGQASLEDAKALVDEGVTVAPLPFPVRPPDTVN